MENPRQAGSVVSGPAARPSIKSRCSAFETQARPLDAGRAVPRSSMSKSISDRLQAWSVAIAAETSPQVLLDAAVAEKESVASPPAAEEV